MNSYSWFITMGILARKYKYVFVSKGEIRTLKRKTPVWFNNDLKSSLKKNTQVKPLGTHGKLGQWPAFIEVEVLDGHMRGMTVELVPITWFLSKHPAERRMERLPLFNA